MASTGADRQSAAPAGNDSHQQKQHCDLFRCFCCWRRRSSPCIPRVVPGQDYYACVPAGANDDDRPMWSVLVCCTSAGVPSHNLRLHRFRVAGSGRVIGRSDDLLEPLRGVSPDDDDGRMSFADALAALSPDRRRLYIVCAHSSPGKPRTRGRRCLPKHFPSTLATSRASCPCHPSRFLTAHAELSQLTVGSGCRPYWTRDFYWTAQSHGASSCTV